MAALQNPGIDGTMKKIRMGGGGPDSSINNSAKNKNDKQRRKRKRRRERENEITNMEGSAGY